MLGLSAFTLAKEKDVSTLFAGTHWIVTGIKGSVMKGMNRMFPEMSP